MKRSAGVACAALLLLGCSSEAEPGGGSPSGGASATAGSSGGGMTASAGTGVTAGMPGSGGRMSAAAGTGGGSGTGTGGSGTSGTGGSGGADAGAGSGGAGGVGSGGRSESGGAGTTAGTAGQTSGGQSNGGGGGTAGGAGASAAGAPSAGAGAGGGSAGSGTLEPLTIYIAGDSTVSKYTDTASTTDQAGWGQMLGARFDSRVTVDNRAIGGRTARRFIDDGALDGILEDIAAGDYFLVQFGTNDGNKTATYELDGQMIPYYLDPATDFKTYLQMYIDGAHDHGAIPVLVTPPPRNSAYCTGGNGTGAHADAMRQLGMATGVAVLDLNKKSVDYLKAICPSPTPEDFFLLKSDGSVDGTHFQENGARILASFVTDEMVRLELPLAAALK